jgi:nucleoside-diphosphate-sugar epimerase
LENRLVVEHHQTTVLVTGASGFVGRPLVSALARANYAVRASTRKPALFPPGVDCTIVPDFANSVDWDPLLRGVDIVVHTAGLAHADSIELSDAAFDRINRIATQDLACAAARAGVKQFIFISSVRAQAGASSEHVLREDDEPYPTDAYGRSKLGAEAAVHAAGVPYTILRPVVIYGPNPRANVRLLLRIASLPVPLPFRGLNNRRSILGIDNLVSAILFALNNSKVIGETFLVADPRAVTICEIFVMLRQAQGRRPRLIYIPPKLFQLALIAIGDRHLWNRIGGDLVVDTNKLESAGWHAPVDVYGSLAATLPGRTG